MNLKFYLRGLGIGIIVTAVIMLVISSRLNKPLSDEEIKLRAGRLGMVEADGKLTDVIANNASQDQDQTQTGTEASGDETQDPTNEKLDEIEQLVDDADAYLEEKNGVDHEYIPDTESETEPEPEANPEPTPEPTPEPAPEPEPEPEQKPADNSTAVGNSGSFVISKGEDSYTIAQHLQSAGYISDARAFDTYLCQNGYDRKLSAGTYEITSGISESELAQLLVKK